MVPLLLPPGQHPVRSSCQRVMTLQQVAVDLFHGHYVNGDHEDGASLTWDHDVLILQAVWTCLGKGLLLILWTLKYLWPIA